MSVDAACWALIAWWTTVPGMAAILRWPGIVT
jgi:hypothetical protein